VKPVLPFLLVVLLGGACSPQPLPAQQRQKEIVWHSLGSWSGTGNLQADSFTSETGALRIQWATKRAGPAEADGRFRLTIHSAISGRPLAAAVDHRGPGTGTAFVSEDPRVFFTVVESHDLEWSFTVAERLE
jgi:hypothetical protein